MKFKKEDFIQEEIDKCKSSPVYFYNKYIFKEGMREFTEKEYLHMKLDAERIRNGLPPSWKMGRIRNYPLSYQDCFVSSSS